MPAPQYQGCVWMSQLVQHYMDVLILYSPCDIVQQKWDVFCLIRVHSSELIYVLGVRHGAKEQQVAGMF